jgi:glycosyltransferase involved in cell wall biosynthesis
MSVSVVVPTTGHSADLRRSLGGMIRAAALAGPDAEVLVVVNGRTSLPALAHLDSPLLRVLFLERANVARARNVGIAQARHDVVVFGDDGAAVAPTWCVDFVEALRDPGYPVVTAPVRVPVLGPVTAFLNHQRIFDAPPLDAIEARTVTGHCALRRDRLPAGVRYDEERLPLVGEDVAFGDALRGAGIRIRWLAGAAAGLHLLPERIEEITERAFRYGRGAALIWSAGRHGAVVDPAAVAATYRGLAPGDDHPRRRFPEVVASGMRTAFTVYEYLFMMALTLGYLAELGGAITELDRDGLRRAWHDIAEQAAIAAHRDGEGRVAPRLDYARLDCADPPAVDRESAGVPAAAVLIDEAWQALRRHTTRWRGPETPTPAPPTGDAAPAPDGRILRAAWRRMRAAGGPVDADDIDNHLRAIGFGFQEGCALIEFAVQRAARASRR